MGYQADEQKDCQQPKANANCESGTSFGIHAFTGLLNLTKPRRFRRPPFFGQCERFT
jgi:hypothetical protein